MPEMPITVQTVKNVKGKWVVDRWTICPDHLGKTTQFQGVSEQGDLFRCKETAEHTSHLFYSKPARNAPKTPEEAAKWLAAEIDRQSRDPKKS